MTLYGCRDKQDAKITFLVMRFYMIVGINKNANKKGCSNSEFSCIQAMASIWPNRYSFFLL